MGDSLFRPCFIDRLSSQVGISLIKLFARWDTKSCAARRDCAGLISADIFGWIKVLTTDIVVT